MRKIFLLAATLSAMMIFTGCGSDDETSHPLFKKGESAQKAGNGAEAAAAYKELIQKREDCVQSHLKLATVYDELLNDPLMAAVHYRIYLEKNPQAQDAATVKAWLERAEKRYYEAAKSKFGQGDAVVGSSAEDTARIEELENQLEAMRARYENMRKQLNSSTKSGKKNKR
jgi:TolA-binding protein